MNTAVPLVSVIVPAFNAESWIHEAVGSVTTQSYGHLEIIVVDDGSTDATRVVVAEFQDSRLQVITQEQRGACAARNRGLSLATGSLIQFLDADDVLSSEKIARQVDALKHAAPATIASCEWVHLGSHGIRRPSEQNAWRVTDPIDWLVASLRGGGMMQPAAWLTPRAVIDRAGTWNELLTLHDDGDFFARVLAHAAANLFVDDAVVMYRDNPVGLSKKRNRKAAESALAVCRSRHAVIIERRSDPDALSAIATQYAQFAYEFAPTDSDLADQALDEIAFLGVAPQPIIGGTMFRAVMRLAGFPAAMGFRGFSQRLRTQ